MIRRCKELRDITGAHIRETMGMEHDYTDAEKEQIEAGRTLRRLDRVAESIEHNPDPAITDKETSR